MKKLFFVIFSITFFFLIFISEKKIKENIRLDLNKKYHIVKYQDYFFDGEIEYLLIGPEYTITHYAEKNMSDITLDYYGDVENLEKMNGLWIGKLAPYDEIARRDYLRRDLFLDELGEENHKKFLKNYREYFIIGENIEKFNLTEQEVINYTKAIINFKNPDKFIQKYGNESDFTTEYAEKKGVFFSKGYNLTDEQLLKIFKKRKYVSILITILVLLMEIILYKTIKNYKKDRAE